MASHPGEGTDMEILYGIAFFVVILGIAILAHRIRVARTNRGWQEAATRLGLNFTPPSFWSDYQMGGMTEGGQCLVYTNKEYHGSHDNRSSTTYTNFEVRFPQSLNLGLNLSHAGIFSGLATMMGSQDIQVGYDAEFDKEFTVKGRDENKIREFLTPERKQQIVIAHRSMKKLNVGDESVSWTTKGVIRDSDSIVVYVTQLTDLAAALSPEEEINQIFDM